MVLDGGKILLKKSHPLLLCEVNGNNCGMVSDLLTNLGYAMFDLNDRSVGRIKSAAFNTLAMHEKGKM